MKSLLELISQHSDANSMIPLIGIASVITIILIYSFIKIRWVKYLISIVALIIGSVIFYRGYETMLEPIGLELIITGTKVLVFGIVAFAFSLIMDILDSLAKMFKGDMKKKKEKSKKDSSKKNDNDKETKVLKKNDEDTKLLSNLDNNETTVIDNKSTLAETTIVTGNSILDDNTTISDRGMIGDETKILQDNDIIDDNTKLIDRSEIDDATKLVFSEAEKEELSKKNN